MWVIVTMDNSDVEYQSLSEKMPPRSKKLQRYALQFVTGALWMMNTFDLGFPFWKP